MKRRKFRQNKLWRDKTIEKVKKEGAVLHMQKLTEGEFDVQLRRKLCEESQEVLETSTQEELIDELGDMYEVIDALCELHGLDKEIIKARRAQKRAERGDYSGRQFVTAVEYPEGSYGEQCCLEEPDMYPEILD